MTDVYDAEVVTGDEGPGFQVLITPAMFREQLERIRGIIDATAADVAAAPERLTPAQRAGWTNFVRRWGGFLADHGDPGLLDVALSGPYNTIFAFEREAIAWRANMRPVVRFSTPDPTPSTPFGQGAQLGEVLGDAIWAAVALGGLYLLTRK